MTIFHANPCQCTANDTLGVLYKKWSHWCHDKQRQDPLDSLYSIPTSAQSCICSFKCQAILTDRYKPISNFYVVCCTDRENFSSGKYSLCSMRYPLNPAFCTFLSRLPCCSLHQCICSLHQCMHNS